MTHSNNSSAIIFLEVNEPSKAPDLRYITVGSSDNNKTDIEFENSAIAYFKTGNNFPVGTTFILKAIQRFENQETYILFLQNQITAYLDSLK